MPSLLASEVNFQLKWSYILFDVMQSSKMSLKSNFFEFVFWLFLLGYYLSINLVKTPWRLGNYTSALQKFTYLRCTLGCAIRLQLMLIAVIFTMFFKISSYRACCAEWGPWDRLNCTQKGIQRTFSAGIGSHLNKNQRTEPEKR